MKKQWECIISNGIELSSYVRRLVRINEGAEITTRMKTLPGLKIEEGLVAKPIVPPVDEGSLES